MSRPGMSCSDNNLTDDGLRAGSANDDTVDVWSAADLMGTGVWLDYVTRWNPLRWVPKRPKAKRRSA